MVKGALTRARTAVACGVAAVAALIGLGSVAGAIEPTPGGLTLLSTSTSGTKANLGVTGILSVSSDGSVLVFESQNSTTLTSPAPANPRQVYVKDVATGVTSIVSAAADGTPGNGLSWQARVSANGRYVAFVSSATNLHPDDTNSGQDVYVKDLATGAIELASTDSAGVVGTGGFATGPPRVSDDGNVVVFATNSTLDPAHTQGDPAQLYAKRLDTGAVTLLSDPSSGQSATNGTVSVDMTPDGSTVVLTTYQQLAAGDTDTGSDAYVIDTTSGAATLASEPPGGDTDLASAFFPSISDDGTRVVYQGSHRGVTGSTQTDIWLKDLTDGSLTQVTAGANALSQDADISPDGRFVSYASNATNLVVGDMNQKSDVFLEEIASDDVRFVSQTSDGVPADDHTFLSVVTSGAKSVFFQTRANNLSPLDTDAFAYEDIYRATFAPPDTDGDGIPDDLDTDPNNASGGFADAAGTAGEVTDNGTGEPVLFEDLTDPDGVRIVVGGTTGQVTVSVCGGFTLRIPAGSSLTLTCGSAIVGVTTGGPVVLELAGERTGTIAVPDGMTARVTLPVNDEFTVEALSGAGYVTVDLGEVDHYGDPLLYYVSTNSGVRTFSLNVAPEITSVQVTEPNSPVGDVVDVVVSFNDPGVTDTHSCDFTWEPGVSVTGVVDQTAMTCTGSHTYTTTGIYNVSVRVTDSDGGIAFTGSSVGVYDPDWYWTYAPAESFEANPTSFGGIIGIDVDSADNVWVIRNNARQIAKYTANGTLLAETGGFGTGPGQFNSPVNLAVSPTTDDVFVADNGNARVQRFDSDGTYISSFSGGFSNMLGIAVDAVGDVWVSDFGSGFVRKYSPTGAYLGALGGTGSQPGPISVDPDGNIWVSDFSGSRNQVHKIDPATGTRLLTLSGFGQPLDFAFDTAGQVHIVNFNDRTIRTHLLDGTFVDSRNVPVVPTGNGNSFQPYIYRGVIDGQGRLLIGSSASNVLVFRPPAPVDTDGDGIPDDLDTDPNNASGGFADAAGTAGEVTSNGTGEPVLFEDLTDPDGVKIIVGGTTGQVTVRVCGLFSMQIPAGSEVNVTCGSVTVDVISVPDGAVITIAVDGDVPATVTIPGGVTAKITETAGTDAFTVEHLGGTGTVTITTAGETLELGAGDPPVEATSNVAPAINGVEGAATPVPVSEAVTLVVSFTDPGLGDSHTCDVAWGDGTTSEGEVDQTAGTCTATHTYSDAGVYSAVVTVTDNEGAATTAESTTFGFVVVFDPSAGFVTGGGWIDSPEGAYTADPSLTGRAVFGFNSRYKKGANTPDGSTNFQFQAAGLHFESTAYDWLVVADQNRAKYKGVGSVNGADGYQFMLTAVDDPNGDTFRIKIWETATEAVVYDNNNGLSDDAFDGTALGGGSIVVHTPSRGK